MCGVGIASGWCTVEVDRHFGDWSGSAPDTPPPASRTEMHYEHLDQDTAQEHIGVAYSPFGETRSGIRANQERDPCKGTGPVGNPAPGNPISRDAAPYSPAGLENL